MNKFLISVSGVVMAAAMATAAWADPLTVPNTFTSGTAISASQMNANFTAIQTAVNQAQSGKGSGACVANAADAGGMTRIGPLCVDTQLARVAGDFAGCSDDGVTGCATAAVSTAVGSAATGMSWAQAARACANAGKRLLTAGEWLTAKTVGGLSGIADGTAEYVDAVGASSGTGLVQGSYIGPNLNSGGSGNAQMYANIDYNSDGAVSFISFRCAR